MDLTSLYLRTFFGARPFVSPEMDALAERMGAAGSLCPDPRRRYFMSGAKSVTAATLGGRVIFGKRYFDRLGKDERLAAAAHEFGHILDNDNEKLKITSRALLVSLALTALALLALRSVLVTESAFCVSFLGAMRVMTSKDEARGREEELRCDRVAASFVGGEALIRSIEIAEGFVNGAARGRFRSRRGAAVAPDARERTDAIRAGL